MVFSLFYVDWMRFTLTL